MPRLNRGDTRRVSIKLSEKAKKRILAASNNLGVSQAAMIMYAISNQFENDITKEQILNLESTVILEKEHFAISMPVHLIEKVDELKERFDMKKGAFIGLLVSDYFEKLPDQHRALIESEGETRKITVPINQLLKEKIYQYAEDHYLSISFLIGESIENGVYEGIPDLPGEGKEPFSVTIPLHIYEVAHEGSTEKGVPLHFYIESCLYEAFMSENKIF